MAFDHRPSTAAYMLRAVWPSPGLRKTGGLPSIRVGWRRHRIDPRHLARFLRLTGLRADRGVPMLYPHVFGFPLHMVILTHPAFPLPIWGALQVRNHLLQRRPISADAVLDLETRVARQRVLDKGVEVDLHTTVRAREEEPVWESLVTFYYRGRFGAPEGASPLARAPTVGDTVVAGWRTSSGVGWRFGSLTGDYNGIHCWSWYARLFGFRGAFHHPQLVLGQCVAHLAESSPGDTERLDAWLKGPVYYDADVSLRATGEGTGTAFALIAAADARPAILGRWSRGGAAGSGLFDEPDQPV